LGKRNGARRPIVEPVKESAVEDEPNERGKRATFDPDTGEVHGSGSGAGGEGNPGEDYDSDSMAGAGADPMGAPQPEEEAQRGPIDPAEGQHS
jgi:hypothetical protein